MKKADQKIVMAFPDVTDPHELLTKHGLSLQAYEEMVATKTAEGQQTMQASRIEVETPQQKLKPSIPANIVTPIVHTSAIPAHLNGATSKMRVRAKGTSGAGTLMSAASAMRMIRRGGYEQC